MNRLQFLNFLVTTHGVKNMSLRPLELGPIAPPVLFEAADDFEGILRVAVLL